MKPRIILSLLIAALAFSGLNCGGGGGGGGTTVNTTLGGARGTITIPVQSYRPAAQEAVTPAPESAAPLRDLTRAVRFGNKGVPVTSCEGENFVPGEIILKLETGGPAAGFAAARGLAVSNQGLSGAALVSIDVSGLSDSGALELTREKCLELDSAPGVKYADLNRIAKKTSTTPNDVHYSKQWHYNLINLPQTWDVTTGSASVIVAVLDTGIVSGHADIDGKLVSGYDFVSSTNYSCDGNGRDSNPEDVADSRCTTGAIPTISETHSGYHGTHVAGTIAAETNNAIGVAGVNWSAKIMPVRVLGAGGGTDYDIQQGMLYAAGLTNVTGAFPASPAKIINMSLGGDPGTSCPSSYNDVFDQVYAAGVAVFVAAGNEYETTGNGALNPLALCNNAIAVAAVDKYSNHAPYSNTGAGLDIAAPGGSMDNASAEGILSTVRDDSNGINTAYAYMEGTSMATPHAAGVAALMISAYSFITPLQIATIMAQTATDLGTAGTDNTYGAGLINAYSAVIEAQRLGEVPDEPVTPVIAVSASSIYFAYTDTTKTVIITNTGTGTLSLTNVTDTENSGGNWLSTSTTTGANSITLTATVNRTGLSSGTYTATINISSNGGNAAVSVTMQVNAPSAPSQPGCTDTNIYVLLIDEDMETLAWSTLAAGGGLFTVGEVPVGSDIYVVAGNDCDQDDYICEQDVDLCGMYPMWMDPRPISVVANTYTSNLNFEIDFRTVSRIPSGATPPKFTGPFKRK